MKRMILAMALCASLSACSGLQVASASDQAPRYADALYAVAQTAAREAVKLGRLSQARYDELDARAQAILVAIHAGSATIEQLAAVTDQMKPAR